MALERFRVTNVGLQIGPLMMVLAWGYIAYAKGE